MRKIATLLVIVAAALVIGACAHGGHHAGGPGGPNCPKGQDCPPCPNCPKGGPAAAAAVAPQSTGVIYWCACGPECKCNVVGGGASRSRGLDFPGNIFKLSPPPAGFFDGGYWLELDS